jgi:hypothetical protein
MVDGRDWLMDGKKLAVAVKSKLLYKKLYKQTKFLNLPFGA